jgi:ubiquinone/menaquinone biosynthesis C-methylase UbiE
MDTPTLPYAKSRVADSYDDAGTAVQMEILKRTAELMKSDIGAGEIWCDVGSGSGMLLQPLEPLPAETRFVCLDLAFTPLRLAVTHKRAKFAVCGDIELPPVRPKTFDGATAASVLQWAASPQYALRNIAAILKPSAPFYFSVFVDGSFAELVSLRSRMGLREAAWLPAVDELLNMLDRAGFSVSAGGTEIFEKVPKFPDAMSALGSLSGIGVTATGGRLLNRGEIRKLCMDYTVMFAEHGKVPLTYKAIIGKAVRK